MKPASPQNCGSGCAFSEGMEVLWETHRRNDRAIDINTGQPAPNAEATVRSILLIMSMAWGPMKMEETTGWDQVSRQSCRWGA